MFSSVYAAAVFGIDILPVRVEVDVSDGLPSFSMVGYVSSQVREAQDRVRTAMKNMKISLPPKKITVNLAPADVRKEGAGFDLPVAGAVLAALGYIPAKEAQKMMMLGELSLNGKICPVPGVLPSVMKAKEMGCGGCIIPAENLREGRLVEGIPVIGVHSLAEVIEVLNGKRQPQEPLEENTEEEVDYGVDFSDICGQETVKRAALVAAAGMHNLLLTGSPGSGKTMVAKRIPTILPPLTREESLEITKIYSIAGLLPADSPIMKRRPFRSPHHTTPPSALAGGGRVPRPGEVTLAHRSVLFLDELPEFSRTSLEILRQPLEEHCIHLSRVWGNCVFPANFMLVAAMNPCPCGYYPDMNRCSCSRQEIHRYLHKISQPLLDRIDLCVEVPAVSWDEMHHRGRTMDSAGMREQVMAAQRLQKERFAGEGIFFNSDMNVSQVEKYCQTDEKAKALLQQAFSSMGLSARGYHRILKVARTIADLRGAGLIEMQDLTEALAFRMLDKSYWSV